MPTGPIEGQFLQSKKSKTWSSVITLSYYANGADTGTVPAKQEKQFCKDITLATNSGTLKRTGYVFKGWNTQADGTGTSYMAGDNYTEDKAITLYAEWWALVNYDANGADTGTVPAKQEKKPGQDLTLADNSGTLARTGYVFKGWNTDAKGKGDHYDEGQAGGSLLGAGSGTIRRSYAKGEATGGTEIGGFVEVSGANLVMEDCYANVLVSGSGDSIGGGLMGFSSLERLETAMPWTSFEVFTTPDCRKTHGSVMLTRPVEINDLLVEDAYFEFEEGKVTSFSAKKGQEALRILFEDPGSRRIGEIALVDKHSPVARSRLFFYDTLVDENAAIHMAFGQAYIQGLEGGARMKEQQLDDIGFNNATYHSDVMIGDEHTQVEANCYDGRTYRIMESGEFVI
ncbi:hypothetical protein LSH36_793g01223 [Paralvinella palmiformis]|uniref:Listeria/Bacterioides repeat-containing protein n=1 Tax=Paralvinella palmiformis TaxID=53620 RepID=A0AAD9MSD8_9ANNE|nr:hypothetical protein LSH36_793g01223 [Paralvinella palmiformis]